MKHKVAELEGALLDAAVAKAERRAWRVEPVTSEDRRVTRDTCMVAPVGGWEKRVTDWQFFCPSYDWAVGGPIIEREKIAACWTERRDIWFAHIGNMGPQTIDEDDPAGKGPTPLIAAMRAYVASKFGDEVDL